MGDTNLTDNSWHRCESKVTVHKCHFMEQQQASPRNLLEMQILQASFSPGAGVSLYRVYQVL